MCISWKISLLWLCTPQFTFVPVLDVNGARGVAGQCRGLTSSPELQMRDLALVVQESEVEAAHVVEVQSFEWFSPPEVLDFCELEWRKLQAKVTDVECRTHWHFVG